MSLFGAIVAGFAKVVWAGLKWVAAAAVPIVVSKVKSAAAKEIEATAIAAVRVVTRPIQAFLGRVEKAATRIAEAVGDALVARANQWAAKLSLRSGELLLVPPS